MSPASWKPIPRPRLSGHLAALLALPVVGARLARCFLFNFDVQVLTRAIYKFDIVSSGLNGFSG